MPAAKNICCEEAISLGVQAEPGAFSRPRLLTRKSPVDRARGVNGLHDLRTRSCPSLLATEIYTISRHRSPTPCAHTPQHDDIMPCEVVCVFCLLHGLRNPLLSSESVSTSCLCSVSFGCCRLWFLHTRLWLKWFSDSGEQLQSS